LAKRVLIPPVSIFLDQPIFHQPLRKLLHLGMDILSILSTLELKFTDGLEEAELNEIHPTELDDVQPLIEQLNGLVRRQSDYLGQHVGDYMKQKGLVSLFPITAAKLKIENTGLPQARQGIHDHFKNVCLMNQIMTLALQIYHDADLPRHPYVVYQLTALYHSLGYTGVEFKAYRKQIGEKFDSIKEALGGSAAVAAASGALPHHTPSSETTGRLSPTQREWIKSVMLGVVRKLLSSTGGSFWNSSKPLVHFLYAVSHAAPAKHSPVDFSFG